MYSQELHSVNLKHLKLAKLTYKVLLYDSPFTKIESIKLYIQKGS